MKKVELYFGGRPLSEILSREFVQNIEVRELQSTPAPTPVSGVPQKVDFRPGPEWISLAEAAQRGKPVTTGWQSVNGLKIYSNRRQRWLDNLSILGFVNDKPIFGWPPNGNKPELRHETATVENVFIQANRL
jgi:hypothetical protein